MEFRGQYTYFKNDTRISKDGINQKDQTGCKNSIKFHPFVSFGYDGFGNRVSESRSTVTTTYTYDALNRVESSSRGDEWTYDKVGNTVDHTWNDGNSYTRIEYDNENRAHITRSKDGGDATVVYNWYDAAGNGTVTRITASKYAFDEVTEFDVRYDTTYKYISRKANWVKGARYLYGASTFSYDVNGQLTYINRGRPKGERYNKVGAYTYDNEGKILDSTDRGGVTAQVGQTWAFGWDPSMFSSAESTTTNDDTDAPTQVPSLNALNRQVFGSTGKWYNTSGYDSAQATYHSYVYANGNPVADVSRDSTLFLKQLDLNIDEVTELTEERTVEDEELGTTRTVTVTTGYEATVLASDLRYDAEGNVDRHATTQAIADRLYGLSNLTSQEARDGLVATIEAKLPEPLSEGDTFLANRYLVVLDRSYGTTKVTTDYAYRAIGGKDGLGGGAAQSHIVAAGDSLQALAAAYYGSPSYWYLIAEANGLSGSEELTPGTRLSIPNVVANSINDKDTYKLYNENDIIGSDSPVVHVKQKKKKWYQKLVQILIVVIIVVVAAYTAGLAAGMFAQAMGASAAALSAGGAVAAGATFAAGIGITAGVGGFLAAAVASYAIGQAAGMATSFVTQGLAIMVGLQDSFDWKAMHDMGNDFGVSAVASGITGGVGLRFSDASLAHRAIRAGAEAGVQIARNDGKLENITGVLMAMVPGADKLKGASTWNKVEKFASEYRKGVSAGLSLIEKQAETGDALNTMDWVSFAVAAVGAAQTPSNTGLPPSALTGTDGFLRDALLSAAGGMIVGAKYGEDVGFDFFGTHLGNAIADNRLLDGMFESWAPVQEGMTAARLLEGAGLNREQKEQILNDPGKRAEAARIAGSNLDPTSRAKAVNMLAGPSYMRLASLHTVSDAGREGLGDLGTPVAPTPESEAMAGVLAEMMSGPSAPSAGIMVDGLSDAAGVVEDSSSDPMLQLLQQVLDPGSNLSDEERRAAQQYLFDRGHNLGQTGEWGDGVDGDIGDLTRTAARTELERSGIVIGSTASSTESISDFMQGMIKAAKITANQNKPGSERALAAITKGAVEHAMSIDDPEQQMRELKAYSQALTEMSSAGSSSTELNLGPNEIYREDIMFAAERTGLDPAVIAAVINAEAGTMNEGERNTLTDKLFYEKHPELIKEGTKIKISASDTELIKEWKEIKKSTAGTWSPGSAAGGSTAKGLTQFVVGTWISEAERSGTYLNEQARALGYVNENNEMITKHKSDLLALRSDPRLAIVAAAEYDKHVFAQLNKDNALFGGNLTDEMRSSLLYIGHHEGPDGARQVLGLDPFPDETAAKPRFEQQMTWKDNKGVTHVNYDTINYWKDAAGGSYADGYRAWLWDYTAKKVDPSRYR